MTRDDWQPYLLSGESLEWSGESHYRFLQERALLFVAICAGLGLWSLYLAMQGQTLAEVCPPHHYLRHCARNFYARWPVAIILIGVSGYSAYELIARAQGKIRDYYAITSFRLLKITVAPHLKNGQKLTEARIAGLTLKFGDSVVSFRSGEKGKSAMIFSGLSFSQANAARAAFNTESPEAAP